MADSNNKILAGLIGRLGGKDLNELRKQSTKGVFAELTDSCVEMFPERIDKKKNGEPVRDDVRRGLLHLLEVTGPPKAEGDAERIAEIIVGAMANPSGADVHLCPLDNGDDIPNLRFGPCEVRHFAEADFEEIIEAGRLRRHYPGLKLESDRLARFHWLVVREPVTFAATIGHRSSPFRFLNLNEDFGAIEPFARKWPEIVDRAVTALVLLPMEEMVHHPDVDWRTFRIPWVYTVTGDVLASPAWPPDADTLHWEPDLYVDPETGEEEEGEKPFGFPLDEDSAPQHFAKLDDSRWQQLEAGYASPMVNPLAGHFLTRAFLAEGIDEFLAHVTAIEAAVGLQTDYGIGGRIKARGNPNATQRMARRVAGLTGDPATRQQFHDLFNVRSNYVHGRHTPAIPGQTRILARTLARRVVEALMVRGNAGGYGSREAFLSTFCP